MDNSNPVGMVPQSSKLVDTRSEVQISVESATATQAEATQNSDTQVLPVTRHPDVPATGTVESQFHTRLTKWSYSPVGSPSKDCHLGSNNGK